MRKPRSFLTVLVIVMICAAGTNALFAQIGTAQLNGKVRDES
jgi:hypothetical protein